MLQQVAHLEFEREELEQHSIEAVDSARRREFGAAHSKAG